MEEKKEVQTAREICNLINQLNDLLWEKYGEDFLDLQEEDDPCLGPLGPLGLLDAQDKKER